MRVAALALLTLAGCPPAPEPEPTCDLSLDALAGTQWVMWEAQPDQTTVRNPMARGRFTMEDGTLHLAYTTKSPSDVFDYTCKVREDRVICRTERNLLGWCAALEAHEPGSCTKSRLRDLGARSETDEELLAAMHEAKAAREEAERAGRFEQFRLANNNMGNKLESVVYVEILESSCQLVFTDNYRALYNGRWIEDSNVVGTNPFVEAEEEYLFEHCADFQGLVGLTEPELPEQIPPQELLDVGTEVHYFYVGETAVEPEDGCTYQMDAYAQWVPVEKGRTVPVGEDGRLDWHTSHTWDDLAPLKLANPANPTAVYTIVRSKTCGGGEPERIDVVCTANFFKGGTGAPAEGGEDAAE